MWLYRLYLKHIWTQLNLRRQLHKCIKCSCDPPACLYYLFKQQEDFATFLFPHPNPPIICPKTQSDLYPHVILHQVSRRYQSECEIQGKDELNTHFRLPPSRLPRSPYQRRQRWAQPEPLCAAPARDHADLRAAITCQPAVTAISRVKHLTLSMK